MFKAVTGGESKHTLSNDNGTRLINFAMEQKMKIMSTHFKRKEIYKGTWVIPGTNTTNQIDSVLIEEKHAKLIMNVRIHRGANVDSDHLLVVTKIQLDVPKDEWRKRGAGVKYDMTGLQMEEVASKYRSELDSILSKGCQENQTQEIEGRWRKIENAITKTTERTLQKQKPRQRKDWFDGECRKEIDKKKQLRIRYLESGKQEDEEKYKKQRRITSRICRENKRKAYNGKVLEMEANYKQRNIKNFYRAIKEIKQEHKPKRIFTR